MTLLDLGAAHDHIEWSHHDGEFYCACGAHRRRPGVWSTPKEGRAIRARRARAADRIRATRGTSVDAYGQSLLPPEVLP